MTIKVAIIGLGYVGLPLARLFATKYPVTGFDINRSRIAELQSGKTVRWKWPTPILKPYLKSKFQMPTACCAPITSMILKIAIIIL